MKSLSPLTNSSGKITIAALDHRGSLKKELHPDNPESTKDSEILSWKRELSSLFKDEVSGILIDPIYGKAVIDTTWPVSWMLSMEETGYRGEQQARETTILPNWSVAQAKAMGASSVKLLLYYDPDNRELAQKQRIVAERIAQDCLHEGLLFLLEPLSYGVTGAQQQTRVLQTVEDLKDLAVDIFKLEYPGDAEACRLITDKLGVPWILLSAGMPYDSYKEALQIACQHGASGLAVGRAVWQEFGQYQGVERQQYFQQTALPRMQELVGIVNQYGKSV
jgi:tagatose 1,6-diphosphate aldolase